MSDAPGPLDSLDDSPSLRPEERLVLEGERFSVHEMQLIGDDGKSYKREVIRHPGAVVLLPLLDDDRVVMIRNARPTVGEVLLELPAGTREPDEAPEVTARRELAEETGYVAEKFDELHRFYSAPGISDEMMHLFVARSLTEGKPDREAVEQIENQIVHRDQIELMIREGKIRDAKTLIGLYAFLFHSARTA
ncbi:MAG: NUDIX hydrolase [Planctomycetota bacterium]